jgi:L-ribulose-5-phosphate 4-epimerase
MLEQIKEEVFRLNLDLPRYGLVTWTSGNVSVRDPESGLVVIKPSGIRYENMRADQMVVLDVNGKVLEGSLKPSSDTATHLYIYRQRPDVFGMVHTHSNYATAFAALGKPIPAVLTALCDEFGGPIPVGAFALIGGEEIGKEIVRSIGNSVAILMQNHGVFTIGTNGEEAVKAAVMVEDVARTIWIALQMGEPLPIPDEAIARLRNRYVTQYGQK